MKSLMAKNQLQVDNIWDWRTLPTHRVDFCIVGKTTDGLRRA